MKTTTLNTSLRLALASGLGMAAVSQGLYASGFALPETSIAGIGLSNALVANPVEPGAVSYNAAAMAFHEHSSATGGLMVIAPNLKVTTSTGTHDSQSEDRVLVPNFQGVLKANEDWSVGLGVYSNFGLESSWDLGTFPSLSAALPTSVPGFSLPAGMFHPAQSKLCMATFTPTVAYRFNDNLGLSLGLDYYDLNKVSFNTYAIKMGGDEGGGWGWNLGAMFNNGPLTFGASFHSKATVTGKGDYTVLDSSLGAMGLYDQPLEADLNLPWRLQLGVRYAFTDKLAAEFDFNRTGWSEFDEIQFVSRISGEVLAESKNGWKDSNAYRIGVTYNFTDQTQLRLGYTLDEAGQTDEYFSARIPDKDRQLFSIGIAHGFGSGWQVEGGYMYVLFDDNDYAGTRSYNPAESTDPNGTDAYAGKYEADVHLFGIGVSKKFM